MARTTRRLGWLLVIGVAVSTGCEGDVLRQVRRVTYPPGMQYITEQEIQTTMGALAAEIDQLDQIMFREGGPRIADQARIIEILTRMRTLASQLKNRPHSTHPRIDRHTPQLKRDVERALFDARRDPPNYYYAGAVAGSCSYCHEARIPVVPAERLP